MLLFTLPMAEQKKPGPTQTETDEHIETGAVSPRLAPVAGQARVLPELIVLLLGAGMGRWQAHMPAPAGTSRQTLMMKSEEKPVRSPG